MRFLQYLQKKYPLFPFVLSLVLIAGLTACGGDDDDNGMGANTEMNIVEQAQGNDNLSTLAQAIEDAGLAGTLESNGPFTVFAPTDAAFDNLPEGTLSSLSTEELADILTFHVLEGEVASGDLQPSQTVETVQGEEILITADGGAVTINGSSMVTAA
ncbi:MAG: fasciclin domain-containing protein [Balneolaceae bacterium]|nr:fasciclin domain-containing protein [Balneolaceae bacterium]